MKLTEQVREGLRNLYFSKLRTFLALLGILVGTASVVAMVLGGELATNEALKQFKTLGTDLLAVTINTNGSESKKLGGKIENLSLTDLMKIQKTNINILQVAPYSMVFYPVSFAGNPLNSIVLGVTSEFTDMMKVKIKNGRTIKTLDHYAYYAVIGTNVYEEIKKTTLANPIGQSIRIGKFMFVIVGVADNWPENSFVYADVNNSILIPLEISLTLNQFISIDNIVMQLQPHADIAQIQENIQTYIQNFLPDKQLNFRSAKELIKKMQQQSDILTIFLGLIGSISLLVGGIGVMNIMLVSVIERRREIGIRMAVGAKRKDIVLLFLSEAVILSMLGGLLGILIGLIIAYGIALFSNWEFVLLPTPLILGFSVSVLVGILSGFYPAYLAAKLDPMEALRL